MFPFSILLLAVQMASGQLSPRIIARVFEDRLTKLTIGAFVFTWVYTLAAVVRIEERVPQLSILLAILLSLASVGLFFHLVQRASESLRPVKTLTDVAHDTRAVIESVYPSKFSDTGREPSGPTPSSIAAVRTIAHRGRSGVVLAFDWRGLAHIGSETDCTIELVPMAGDFLATGDDLFRLRGKGATAVDAEILFDRVALGSERTLRQDPAFGFRIIVDIASKALSAAINDPTTAVLAIDQLHHLLHLLGQRELDTGVVRDASGQTRLVYRTPRTTEMQQMTAVDPFRPLAFLRSGRSTNDVGQYEGGRRSGDGKVRYKTTRLTRLHARPQCRTLDRPRERRSPGELQCDTRQFRTKTRSGNEVAST